MTDTKKISNAIRNYVHNECDKEELDYAFSLFEEPYKNLEIRTQLYNVWETENYGQCSVPGPDEFNDMLLRIHRKINFTSTGKKVSRGKNLYLGLAKIAAILLIGALIGVLVVNNWSSSPVYFTSYAPNGSVSQVVLPDNSLVYLNSGSELKYAVNGKRGLREVYLSGEAWFDVEHVEDNQFIVHTPFYDVNVVGTQFNVKAYPEDNTVSTTLERGTVQITSSDQFKIAEDVVLKPGQHLVFDRQSKNIRLMNVNTRYYTSWKDNKLIFINMSLKELVTMLERKYGVEIEMTDSSILNYHYDGTIKNESILEVLDVLKETLPISYVIENQKVIIRHE
ncbi:FecR family protein [Maribellus luteus]|uniref:FecR family protein n=1 Tax=Maribellus luteus TaxID=2305463 RepID=A0A399SR04_9BACT|nr:FecR domain-containing protein [Maribellus luteus]RIJ45808.1 FecR family protein [Maribellus luteus]